MYDLLQLYDIENPYGFGLCIADSVEATLNVVRFFMFEKSLNEANGNIDRFQQLCPEMEQGVLPEISNPDF